MEGLDVMGASPICYAVARDAANSRNDSGLKSGHAMAAKTRGVNPITAA